MGEGQTGNIYLGYILDKSTNIRHVAALKRTEKRFTDDYEKLKNEARILFYLNQLNVSCVPELVYGGSYLGGCYIVATKFYEGFQNIDFSELDDEFSDMFSDARLQLHKNGVFHNDLSPHNVFFFPGEEKRCMIIDFGNSILYKERCEVTQITQFLSEYDEEEEFRQPISNQ